MSLTDYDHVASDDLLKFVETYKGQSAVIYGSSKESYDLTVLTARALILSGSTALEVVDFIDVCNEQTIENLPNKPLCILNYQPDERFVDSKTYKKLERKLFALLDAGYPIITHLPYINFTLIQDDIYNSSLMDSLHELVFHIK